MIASRKAAKVHSESEVKDEEWDWNGERNTGYKATIVGKDGGYLILCLGTKAHQSGFDGYYLGGSYYETNDCGLGKDASYQIWVKPAYVTPTGVDEMKNEPVVKAEKFMKDGKLFIRLGDKTYDLMGRQVK